MDHLFENEPEKLAFLRQFQNMPKPQSAKETIPFLMEYKKKAAEQHIHFSRDEIQTVADVLCENLPPEDQNRIKALLKYMR